MTDKEKEQELEPYLNPETVDEWLAALHPRYNRFLKEYKKKEEEKKQELEPYLNPKNDEELDAALFVCYKQECRELEKTEVTTFDEWLVKSLEYSFRRDLKEMFQRIISYRINKKRKDKIDNLLK